MDNDRWAFVAGTLATDAAGEFLDEHGDHLYERLSPSVAGIGAAGFGQRLESALREANQTLCDDTGLDFRVNQSKENQPTRLSFDY